MDDLQNIPPDQDRIDIKLACLKAAQPVGDLYLSVMDHETLTKITYFDVRRVIQEDRDIEKYLGIQRPLNLSRVIELQKYVTHYDASFPTSIIIAVSDDYVTYDEQNKELIFSNTRDGETAPSTNIRRLARVIDGQHRIAGLRDYKGEKFDVPVTIFVGADISDQAHLFATVNLEQTKVSKSLAYDLYELARSRSPQKTCHNIAVALDQDQTSPFYKRIKRLGVATLDRVFEPITQATFVESVMRYITSDPQQDRDDLLRGKRLKRVGSNELQRLPLRNLFVDQDDIAITQLIYNYFTAVSVRWEDAWNFRGRGYVLNRTNGFRALMRAFPRIYTELAAPGDAVPIDDFRRYFERVDVEDRSFNIENFPPGTSGEARLVRVMTLDEPADFFRRL